MNTIFCFGELLLRLPPANGGAWLRDNQLPVFVGGAELNVATALANWELPVKYGTALPDNIITRDILDYLRQRNIDTSSVILSGERIGLYYLQEGADMKSGENVFDRKHSSFSTLDTGIVDWDRLLDGVGWFHFSAIAPAVSASAAALVKEALEAAARKNITISVDLNYRSLLWKYGVSPDSVMRGLLSYCDVVMGNIWAAQQLLGAPVHESLYAGQGEAGYLAHATETADWIFRHFPRCRWVAQTFRFDQQAGDIRYYASLNNRERQWVSPRLHTETVVEKVGSGDCFMAGLIYGFYTGQDPERIISFAAGAAFGKLQEKGDATRHSVADIQNLLPRYTVSDSVPHHSTIK